MASPADSHLSPADTGAVRLDIEDPSLNAEGGGETEPLRAEDSGKNEKIDYVLVYERCPEEENKDEDSKRMADDLAGMRKQFETSLGKEGAGLILTYPEPEQMKRPLVSSRLFVLKVKSGAPNQEKKRLKWRCTCFPYLNLV